MRSRNRYPRRGMHQRGTMAGVLLANHLKWVIIWVIKNAKPSINPVFTEDFLVRATGLEPNISTVTLNKELDKDRSYALFWLSGFFIYNVNVLGSSMKWVTIWVIISPYCYQ